jgi:hypothetical protein
VEEESDLSFCSEGECGDCGVLLPVVGIDRREVVVKEAEGGRVCGEGWAVKGPH